MKTMGWSVDPNDEVRGRWQREGPKAAAALARTVRTASDPGFFSSLEGRGIRRTQASF